MPDEIDNLLAEEQPDSANDQDQSDLSSREVEELRALKEELDEFSATHGDWRNLKKDYVAKSQRLSELEKRGNTEDTDLGEAERKDLAYLKKLGVITAEEHQRELRALESKISEEQMVEDLHFEIESLSSEYSFVKPKELLEYMSEQSDMGSNLSPESAAKLLYFDQFATLRTKGTPSLPTTDRSNKGGVEEPSPQFVGFHDQKGMHDALLEELSVGA